MEFCFLTDGKYWSIFQLQELFIEISMVFLVLWLKIFKAFPLLVKEDGRNTLKVFGGGVRQRSNSVTDCEGKEAILWQIVIQKYF